MLRLCLHAYVSPPFLQRHEQKLPWYLMAVSSVKKNCFHLCISFISLGLCPPDPIIHGSTIASDTFIPNIFPHSKNQRLPNEPSGFITGLSWWLQWLKSLSSGDERNLVAPSEQKVLCTTFNQCGGNRWRAKTALQKQDQRQFVTTLDRRLISRLQSRGFNAQVYLQRQWQWQLSWQWAGLSSDAWGRVTVLQLKGQSLSGRYIMPYLQVAIDCVLVRIPTSLGSLRSLQGLNLSNNYFSGTIPCCLCSLKKLDYLLIDHNRLNGEIPFTLLEKHHCGRMWFDFRNNHRYYICLFGMM